MGEIKFKSLKALSQNSPARDGHSEVSCHGDGAHYCTTNPSAQQEWYEYMSTSYQRYSCPVVVSLGDVVSKHFLVDTNTQT